MAEKSKWCFLIRINWPKLFLRNHHGTSVTFIAKFNLNKTVVANKKNQLTNLQRWFTCTQKRKQPTLSWLGGWCAETRPRSMVSKTVRNYPTAKKRRRKTNKIRWKVEYVHVKLALAGAASSATAMTVWCRPPREGTCCARRLNLCVLWLGPR